MDKSEFIDILPKVNKALVKNIKACGRYPTEHHITVDNVFWQVLEFKNGFVNILNAYLDLRQNKSVVRINVNSVHLNESTDVIYCQFWYDEESPPTIVKATSIMLMWVFGSLRPQVKFPYLIECPFEGSAPISVSLVKNRCDYAENNVKILDIHPVDGVKKRFGVCSKKARFENRDFTIRFIEWVHLCRILGAEKIHFSYDYVHPDMFEIIQYFEDRGFIETWQYLNPTGIRNSDPRSWQGQQIEVNTQTDCFYRVKNLYDFVAVIDMDEMIMPVMPEDMTWDDMIKRVNSTEFYDNYSSENLYYPDIGEKPIDGIPKYLYMLQHVQRSQNFSEKGGGVKSIVATERVLAIHTHMPHHCISGKRHKCNHFNFPTNISQNSHYRDKIEGSFLVTEEDKTIWKFKDRLMKDVQETLAFTKFAP